MSTPSDGDLDVAYARLIERGVQPTVRALRDEARVSRDRTAQYLRERTVDHEQPPVPAEELHGVLGPLWTLALLKAREALSDTHEAERTAALDSENQALAQVEDLELQLTQTRADAQRQTEQLTGQVEQVGRENDRLTAEADALRAQVEKLSAQVDAERERARAAEVRAERAEGEVDVLREVVGLRKSQETETDH